jgi:truncated hemoglobin YjbI
MDHIYNKFSDELWGKVMDKFYQKNLDDPVIGSLFVGKDVDRIKLMNKNLIFCALNHIEEFTKDEIKQIHSGIRITSRHFERFLMNFFLSMRFYEVGDDELEFLLVLIDYYRDDLIEN